MIYSNNTNNILLLEAELKRLKDLYADALKKQNEMFTLQELRQSIKLLSGRLNTAANKITSSNS